MRRHLEPLVFFGVLAAAWEYGVRWFDVRQYLLPSLSAIGAAAWSARVDLVQHGWVTLLEIVAGFLAAIVAGVAIGLVIHASPMARRTVYPLVAALQSLPKIALAPLMIVWLGYGFASKVAATFLFAFFPIVIATLGGLESTPAHLLEHFRALGATPWTTFRRLRLPSALPALADGVRVALPLAVVGAIVGEFVGAERGLGQFMLMASAQSRTDLMFASILCVTGLALALYAIVERLARLVWWRGREIS
ncbi:MAG: ABC transporter permease [Acidobacteriota bacterium]|nr:ABC transporter permease [Acidobacteriota bacterium]